MLDAPLGHRRRRVYERNAGDVYTHEDDRYLHVDTRRRTMVHLSDGEALVFPDEFPDPTVDIPAASDATEQVTVLAGGCFWCTEAVFKELDGVLAVTSGYSGGTAETAD